MYWNQLLTDMRAKLKSLSGAAPELTKSFGGLSKIAKTGQSLDTKTLELVALGIAIADRCEPCIAFHTEALVKLGTTREEFSDALGICIQMGGGPSLMYASKALACFDEFTS